MGGVERVGDQDGHAGQTEHARHLAQGEHEAFDGDVDGRAPTEERERRL